MNEELRSGAARSQAYWAQQLAFGPVLIHALALAVRRRAFSQDDLDLVREIIPFALSMLGALPDGCDGDPMRLQILARRQAQVLSWGRRRHLVRLAKHLGLDVPDVMSDPVPRRFLRPYRLIGWRPSVGDH
jgi:hypothetical protein